VSRRRARGHSRHALFDWTPAGDVQATEIHANPLTVPCRHETCHAGVWQPCTNHRGRRCDPHPSRRDDADAALSQNPAVPAASPAPEPRTEP
jgi:hypothetical protein